MENSTLDIDPSPYPLKWVQMNSKLNINRETIKIWKGIFNLGKRNTFLSMVERTKNTSIHCYI